MNNRKIKGPKKFFKTCLFTLAFGAVALSSKETSLANDAITTEFEETTKEFEVTNEQKANLSKVFQMLQEGEKFNPSIDELTRFDSDLVKYINAYEGLKFSENGNWILVQVNPGEINLGAGLQIQFRQDIIDFLFEKGYVSSNNIKIAREELLNRFQKEEIIELNLDENSKKTLENIYLEGIREPLEKLIEESNKWGVRLTESEIIAIVDEMYRFGYETADENFEWIADGKEIREYKKVIEGYLHYPLKSIPKEVLEISDNYKEALNSNFIPIEGTKKPNANSLIRDDQRGLLFSGEDTLIHCYPEGIVSEQYANPETNPLNELRVYIGNYDAKNDKYNLNSSNFYNNGDYNNIVCVHSFYEAEQLLQEKYGQYQTNIQNETIEEEPIYVTIGKRNFTRRTRK